MIVAKDLVLSALTDKAKQIANARADMVARIASLSNQRDTLNQAIADANTQLSDLIDSALAIDATFTKISTNGL